MAHLRVTTWNSLYLRVVLVILESKITDWCKYKSRIRSVSSPVIPTLQFSLPVLGHRIQSWHQHFYLHVKQWSEYLISNSQAPTPIPVCKRMMPVLVRKQPSRGALRKRCSENIQQMYRRTPMPKCDFTKVTLYFQNTFS